MPLLKVVVTSRIALGLYNEYVLALGPLALPDAMAPLVQRLRCAGAIGPWSAHDEQTLAQLCRWRSNLSLRSPGN